MEETTCRPVRLPPVVVVAAVAVRLIRQKGQTKRLPSFQLRLAIDWPDVPGYEADRTR